MSDAVPIRPLADGAGDGATDEVSTVRHAVAANMRRARLARAVSLRDLSASTGLSTSLLSQIEREVANPTVAALARIADALDLSFAELTRSTVLRPEIIRRSERAGDAPLARTLFAMAERRRFEISEGSLPPHTAGVPSDHGTGSIEHGYVVHGRITLTVGDEEFSLDEGDAVRFGAGTPHSWSTGDVGASLLTVVVQPDE